MTEPAPGTGTTFDPAIENQPVKLTQGAADAGIQQPAETPTRRSTVIKQISQEEAEADLDELGVDDWLKKHYQASDFNIDSMADVLRETREDIYNRLHALGYELPPGTYSDA